MLLLLGAVSEDVVRDDRAVDRAAEARWDRPQLRPEDHGLVRERAATAAVLRRDGCAQQAQLSSPLPHVAVDGAAVRPSVFSFGWHCLAKKSYAISSSALCSSFIQRGCTAIGNLRSLGGRHTVPRPSGAICSNAKPAERDQPARRLPRARRERARFGPESREPRSSRIEPKSSYRVSEL